MTSQQAGRHEAVFTFLTSATKATIAKLVNSSCYYNSVHISTGLFLIPQLVPFYHLIQLVPFQDWSLFNTISLFPYSTGPKLLPHSLDKGKLKQQAGRHEAVFTFLTSTTKGLAGQQQLPDYQTYLSTK